MKEKKEQDCNELKEDYKKIRYEIIKQVEEINKDVKIINEKIKTESKIKIKIPELRFNGYNYINSICKYVFVGLDARDDIIESEKEREEAWKQRENNLKEILNLEEIRYKISRKGEKEKKDIIINKNELDLNLLSKFVYNGDRILFNINKLTDCEQIKSGSNKINKKDIAECFGVNPHAFGIFITIAFLELLGEDSCNKHKNEDEKCNEFKNWCSDFDKNKELIKNCIFCKLKELSNGNGLYTLYSMLNYRPVVIIKGNSNETKEKELELYYENKNNFNDHLCKEYNYFYKQMDIINNKQILVHGNGARDAIKKYSNDKYNNAYYLSHPSARFKSSTTNIDGFLCDLILKYFDEEKRILKYFK